MYSTPIVPNPPSSPPAFPRARPLGPSSCSFLSPLGHIFSKSVLIAIRRHAALPLHLPYSTYPNVCNCLAKLQLWFSLNFLKLNSHKTENLLFGTKSTLSKPHNFSATINFTLPPGDKQPHINDATSTFVPSTTCTPPSHSAPLPSSFTPGSLFASVIATSWSLVSPLKCTYMLQPL